MSRARAAPTTSLGGAIQERRGQTHGDVVALSLGISDATLYRLERGQHRPSADTALKLAKWLGWTMEQVMEAAGTPAAG